MTTHTPERARVLTMKMQADTNGDLADALRTMADDIDRGQLTTGVSGGRTAGSIYNLRNGNCRDHDSYFKRVTTHLLRVKQFDGALPCARTESEAQIEDGHLTIRLSAATLAHAARHSDYFFRSRESGTPLAITNEAVFAESVCNALNREAEDGSTPITRMLDAATVHVADQGEDGIEVVPTLWAIHIPGPDEFHAAPSRETAEHMAATHTKAMQEHFAKTQRTEGLEMVTAHVAAWPSDAESHATALLEFDYAAWGLKANAP